ncbi:MAG: hypothetical protein KIT80_03010 [Chitinophagaceae bacterium]|nr:hypothetical protein [Chitinophagaceae bacterium]MCW5925855.1 hypothetical protein [Chitinophagaceae bacterium]
MKRTVHFLSILLLSLHLSTGCDGDEKKQSGESTSEKQSDNPCENPPNDSISCLITESEGRGMVENYQDTYAKDCQGHKTCGLLQKGWISKEVAAAMAKLLNDGSGIDGYRVYFTAEENNSERFSGNEHKKGISFTIVPTRDTTIRETDTNSIHVDVWNKLIPIGDTMGQTQNVHINIGKERTTELRGQFETTYRKDHIPADKVDALSKSVWYSEACFNKIVADLRNEGTKGLLFLPGAYFDEPTEVDYCRGRIYANQSSVILVTADEQGQPKWQPDKGVRPSMSSYNHGELCPQKCPPPSGD